MEIIFFNKTLIFFNQKILFLVPECRCEQQQDGENFETTDEHEERHLPFGEVSEFGERCRRAGASDPWPHIAQCRDRVEHTFLYGTAADIKDYDARHAQDDVEKQEIQCPEQYLIGKHFFGNPHGKHRARMKYLFDSVANRLDTDHFADDLDAA